MDRVNGIMWTQRGNGTEYCAFCLRPPRGSPLFIRFHFFLMSEYHVDVAMQIVHKLSYLVTEQIFSHNMSIADI
jgi:hypothetical protein